MVRTGARGPQCRAEGCGTGLPSGIPFCTRDFKQLPYSITKNLWLETTREQAIKDGVQYLKEKSDDRLADR